MKFRLLTPGPTPVPEPVAAAMAQPIIHHRTDEFSARLKKTLEGLKYIFRTGQDVLLFAASGTGAMEAAVTNLLTPGEHALTIEAGKFGERWGDLCEAFGIATHRHKISWGKSLQVDELENLFQKQNFKAVFLTLCETSTGAAIDLPAIAKRIHDLSDTLIVVDGISAIGAMPFEMDAWGIDFAVSGSQKAFQLPPGLAFVCCSERAWSKIYACKSPRFYFDLRKAKKSLAADSTPFTPAISLISGLHVSLEMMQGEGIENIWHRHVKLAHAVRMAVEALGLDILPDNPADSLTAVRIPESLRDQNLTGKLRGKGYWIAGGQGQLKGKIFRIAHMGYCDEGDLNAAIGALETVLADSGWQFNLGAGMTGFVEGLNAHD